MSFPLVSILVPNYKTLALTKICLSLLKKHTDLNSAKIIVIDNDSNDDSLEYLRTVSFIKLIERRKIAGETPVESHARALDLALQEVDTPLVLSIHTDTLIKDDRWLDFLIQHINKRPTIAGVGSWKLEEKTILERFAKNIERTIQLGFYRMIGRAEHAIQGHGKNYYYLRSHCALYRTDLLRKYDLHFADGDMVAGKAMHKKLVDAGYEMLFLPSSELIQYLVHVNHATTVLNPSLSRQKNKLKGMNRVKKKLEQLAAHSVLQESNGDR